MVCKPKMLTSKSKGEVGDDVRREESTRSAESHLISSSDMGVC
jgi:hypothetical protein